MRILETDQDGDPYRQDPGVGGLVPRPLRPDPRFFRRARRGPLLRAILGGLLLTLGLLWAAVFVRDTVRMHAVWSSGELASDVEVRGLRPPLEGFAAQRKPIINLDDLEVTYSDADGVRHHGSYTRWALVAPIHTGAPLVIKYDRADPSSFALSTAIEGARGEQIFIALVLAALAAGSLALLRGARRRLRALAETRELLHSSPEDVVLAVLATLKHEEKGDLVSTEYSLQLPEGPTITETFMSGERPLFLELDESRVLGLRRPQQPGQVLVLRDDLSPLAADEHEDERVRLRYRRLRGERPDV